MKRIEVKTKETILDNIKSSIFEGSYFHYDTLSQKQQKKVSQREQN